MMTLPPFAPFPDSGVRRSILAEEWELYLDTWTSLAELYLRLEDSKFFSAVSNEASLTTFLVSFCHELADDDTILPKALALRKKCFLLIHRIFSDGEVPIQLLKWPVLSDICYAFPKSERLRVLLSSLWKRKGAVIENTLQQAKTSLIKQLELKGTESAEGTLNRIVPLLRLSPDAGTHLMTGSDFLDSLCAAYPRSPPNLRVKLVLTAYLGLTALLQGPKPNYSLLSDHLYSLKSSAESEQKKGTETTLLADLVTNTPLLNKLREQATAPEATRIRSTAASLSAFQQSSVARPKRSIRRRVDKGKGKAAVDEDGYAELGDIHVHRMSLISQVQDLFPDLGSGFVAKLLHEYNDSVEEVTAHLLEESLPAHLASADRKEQLPPIAASSKTHLTPRSTPPLPERRSVFDNDDLDRLAVDTSRLHIGRKNQQLTADRILSDKINAPSKSAILSALAAFDSDDDERDDTYDVEDVGGTVDSAAPGPDEADADLRDKNDEALFKAFSASADVFGRDAQTRRGKARAALKSETGMTDEAIEGWGVMIARDPKRLRRLEARFSTFKGQQTELASTAWRGSPAGSDTEHVEGSREAQGGGRGRGLGHGRGRGRGRGGGGRGGGNVAGPSDDRSTQVSRQRKEANKGSRANHNRRDQRARKMARGGFSG